MLSHDKDLVPRVVIIRANGAHPRCATRIPKAVPRAFLSETGGSSSEKEEAGRQISPLERSPADRRQGRLPSDRDNTPPRGDDIYKLFSRAGILYGPT